MITQDHYLLFQLDGRAFGLPLSQVKRVVRTVDCTPLPQAPAMVIGVIDFRGAILPVLSMRVRFGFDEKEISPDDQFIIASAAERIVAMKVDAVQGIIKRTIDQLVPAKNIFPQVEQIEGVMRSDDGIALIHDLDRFLSADEAQALSAALAG